MRFLSHTNTHRHIEILLQYENSQARRASLSYLPRPATPYQGLLKFNFDNSEEITLLISTARFQMEACLIDNNDDNIAILSSLLSFIYLYLYLYRR